MWITVFIAMRCN